VRFITRLPGLVRYPPNLQAWEAELGPRQIREMAKLTESADFDALAVPEQIVLSVLDAETMGGRWPDAMTTMAFLSGVTDRLSFISTVLILPLHPVVQLAKALATLDVLAEGRTEFGFGVSIFPTEYEVLGVSYKERGRIADEYLAAMRELWTSEKPSFNGRYISFDGIVFDPKPRPGGPTIWIGGDSNAAIRRAARFGGWIPWQTTLENLAPGLEYFRSQIALERPGAGPELCLPLARLEVDADHRPTSGSGRPELPSDPLEVLQLVLRMTELGVTAVTVPTPTVDSYRSYLQWLETFALDVIDPVRRIHEPKTPSTQALAVGQRDSEHER
jgi:alkanesulfonate monooxygenase SsuD/methylene tetrahydromethanopterin reductase-like flavin-dependent oxidoreductase (luciferase family)